MLEFDMTAPKRSEVGIREYVMVREERMGALSASRVSFGSQRHRSSAGSSTEVARKSFMAWKK